MKKDSVPEEFDGQHLFALEADLEKVVPGADFEPAVLFCFRVQPLPRFHTAAVVMIVPAA